MNEPLMSYQMQMRKIVLTVLKEEFNVNDRVWEIDHELAARIAQLADEHFNAAPENVERS